MPVARSPSQPSVDAIVQDIYGSLVQDMNFEQCLRQLAGLFQCHIACLHSEDRCVRRAGMEIYGSLTGTELMTFSNAYSTLWAGKNLWVERSYDIMLTTGYADGDAVVCASDLLASEYYQHFLHPLDMRHGLGISVRTDGQSAFSIVSLNRSARVGPFGDDDMRMVQALRPHLVNAYAIYRQVAALQERAESLNAAFDRLPLGIFVLDLDGQVLEQNEEAARLLGEGRGVLLLAEGGLRMTTTAAQVRFRAALARLGSQMDAPTPEALLLRWPGGDPAGALVLHMCACPVSAGHRLLRGGRVLAFLCELHRHSEGQFATRVLRRALDLTAMESAVVLSLRDHHDPGEVAFDLGLAISTVRSHLKHVFNKTGTSRQSELLRLVDRILSAVPC